MRAIMDWIGSMAYRGFPSSNILEYSDTRSCWTRHYRGLRMGFLLMGQMFARALGKLACCAFMWLWRWIQKMLLLVTNCLWWSREPICLIFPFGHYCVKTLFTRHWEEVAYWRISWRLRWETVHAWAFRGVKCCSDTVHNIPYWRSLTMIWIKSGWESS